MKHPDAHSAWRHLRLPLALAAVLLQGCATAPQAVSVAAPASARPATAAITPQQQAELDAALALAQAGQHEPAIDALRKLAIALPDSAVPAINLALIHTRQDKPELAEAQLKKALAIEPDNPVAGNELAVLYRRGGRFAEARATYERLLAKYPHFAIAHKNLGVLCDLYLKDYPCAIDHYQAYALSTPNDKNVQIWIADLQKRSGTKERQ